MVPDSSPTRTSERVCGFPSRVMVVLQSCWRALTVRLRPWSEGWRSEIRNAIAGKRKEKRTIGNGLWGDGDRENEERQGGSRGKEGEERRGRGRRRRGRGETEGREKENESGG